MNKRTPKLSSTMVTILAFYVACATAQPLEGPGMTVTFSGAIKGKSIDLLNAITSNKQPFPNPGVFGPTLNPMVGGKTMGAAPDGRDLPEWVEFTWKEWPYPDAGPPMPTEAAALHAWNEEVKAMSRALPIKTARVPVKSRVPQDVVDEVLTSNRRAAPGTLPDEMLWVYFIWYETGIKFRWSLEQGCCNVRKSGGDDLTN